jgi:hypothetical protein
LGQAGLLAGSHHQGAKRGLIRGMDGLADPAGGSCHRPGKLIPGWDYPKKGIILTLTFDARPLQPDFGSKASQLPA